MASTYPIPFLPLKPFLRLTHVNNAIVCSYIPNVYYFKAASTLWSDGFYETYNKKNRIVIRFEARSIGTVQSYNYSAIKCFRDPVDSDESHIDAIDAGVGGRSNGVIVEEVISGNKFKVSGYDEKFTEWATKPTAIGLAIFCNGDIDSNFDYIVKAPEYELEDGILTLLKPEHEIPKYIVEKMIVGKALFRLQIHGGMYVYPLGAFHIPHVWTSYEYTISPIPKWDGNKGLRHDTRFVKVGFLINYAQKEEAECLIRNFQIYTLD